ncbi:MAG: hypothetical protein DRP87_07835 [Spirochaetes bacterium]|nr:MAG: hypothetical protein DRP87_07835 [Spirochaetota bacterium]
MIAEEYSCLEYWRKRYKEKEPSIVFNGNDKASFYKWQDEFRKKFIQCLGNMPEDDIPLETEIIEEIENKNYIRKKIVYSTDKFSKIPAYLFIPKNGEFPTPGIICVHGHGRGKVDPAGIAEKEWEIQHIKNYNYDYAVQFAMRGYVSLAPDLRCFGERVDDPEEVYGHVEIEEGSHWCDINFIMGMLIGYNLLTLHIYDIGRGIDLLQSLKEVESERIGCVGLSQGGVTTLLSSAYHERIKVAGVSGYLNSWKSFPLKKGQICGSQIVPGLLRYGDHAEVAGLICPRALFVEFGTKDPIFPVEASRETYKKVKKMYQIVGEEDRIDFEEFDGVHEFKGNRIFEFFDRWL